MGDWDSGGVANLAGKGEARALRAFAAAAVCAAWRSSERMAAAVRGVVEGMGEGWGRVVVEGGFWVEVGLLLWGLRLGVG
jgi:hypothetical protein